VGSGFRHVVYRNNAPMQGGVLHVYIESDGTPYWQRDVSAPDPTPHEPLMLRLMALDTARSVYLGRPCYFSLYRDSSCNATFWTLRRYGPEVLASLEAVLRAETANVGAVHVELFGHSGGGTLAVLLAQRVGNVTRVVTLGANLDLVAWCKLHDYSPLIGSLNPMDEDAMREGVEVLHLVGDRDRNTPPELVASAARARGGEPVRVIPDFDHNCCWEVVWRSILREAP
jgi:pimeloyl-ACP methyl ester carboxylesterase